MNINALLLVLQMAMAVSLAWSCFCRLTKTNGDTRREVRWAMVLEGGAALLLAGTPTLPGLMPGDFDYAIGTTPWPVWLLFLLSILAVQLVTMKYWVAGVPAQFQSSPASRTGQGLAAAIALALVAMSLFSAPAVAEAQGTQPSAPVMQLQLGEQAQCDYPGGCVAMVMPAFQSLLTAAKRGAACPQGGSL